MTSVASSSLFTELPIVRGDRAQLGRVFQNLVASGLKFHADEPPQVSVSAERRNAAWLFSVRDNGVGVPPELGDEIFSMFKRAHGEEVPGVRDRSRRLPQDRGGARWRDLGRARRRRRHSYAFGARPVVSG